MEGQPIHLQYVLILEDDNDRSMRFCSALRDIAPSLEVVVWQSAVKMIEEIDRYLPYTSLVSLDHDLDAASDSRDPGDGLDVARFLSDKSPLCPVVIHSSNVDRTFRMVGVLEMAGWLCRRVAPIGDSWIEDTWSTVAAELLG